MPKINLKGPLILGVSIWAGDEVSERFLIRDAPGETGIVDRTPGFGADELVKIGTQVLIAVVLFHVFAKKAL